MSSKQDIIATYDIEIEGFTYTTTGIINHQEEDPKEDQGELTEVDLT